MWPAGVPTRPEDGRLVSFALRRDGPEDRHADLPPEHWARSRTRGRSFRLQRGVTIGAAEIPAPPRLVITSHRGRLGRNRPRVSVTVLVAAS